MFTTPAQITELQKNQMDAAFALGQTFFDATERLRRAQPRRRQGDAGRVG